MRLRRYVGATLKIVAEAEHSSRLSGENVCAETKAGGLAWARGEISIEKVLNRIRERRGLDGD